MSRQQSVWFECNKSSLICLVWNGLIGEWKENSTNSMLEHSLFPYPDRSSFVSICVWLFGIVETNTVCLKSHAGGGDVCFDSRFFFGLYHLPCYSVAKCRTHQTEKENQPKQSVLGCCTHWTNHNKVTDKTGKLRVLSWANQ